MLIYVIGDTMNTIIQKELIYLLNSHDMTYQELAEKAEIPLETMRNLYYGKVKDPKASTLLAISKVLRISVNRLMGERLYTKEEEDLVMNFRRCGNHGKSMVIFMAKHEATLTRYERMAKNKHIIPCIVPLDVVHDGLLYSSSELTNLLTNNQEAFLAIEINSNSFSPIFCKGDRILIADRFPVNGETAIFSIDAQLYCRIYQENESGYTLKSLNRHGQDFRFKRLDNVNCIGTCIGIVRI